MKFRTFSFILFLSSFFLTTAFAMDRGGPTKRSHSDTFEKDEENSRHVKQKTQEQSPEEIPYQSASSLTGKPVWSID